VLKQILSCVDPKYAANADLIQKLKDWRSAKA